MLQYLKALFIAVVITLGLNHTVRAETAPGLHQAIAQWISDSTTGKRKVSTDTAVKYVREAYKAAEKWGVDPLLLLAYMKPESSYQANARNKSGASGLLQIIPRWHRDKIAKRDIMNYKVNIDVGAQILNEYLIWHDENPQKAMKRYSGGAGSHYSKKIAATYKSLRDVAYGWKMDNDVELIAEHRYADPRRYSKSLEIHADHVARAQAVKKPPKTQLAEAQQDVIYAAYLQAMQR